VINQIWMAHIKGTHHGYTARNTDSYPPLVELSAVLKDSDQRFAQWAQEVPEDELNEMLSFELIGGRPGTMTRAEMLLHVMSHASYHRGFIADILFQIPGQRAPQMDLPVFFGYERGQLLK
jgi:uncharacterized damage-inducible protein DinB